MKFYIYSGLSVVTRDSVVVGSKISNNTTKKFSEKIRSTGIRSYVALVASPVNKWISQV